ncbi:MAG TPA: hypothetical protein VGN63_05670 [Flavisolibacter sp.]|jgi:arylsulfatase|nr:hypothetical protein [Flavisolibacter sp.]
MEPPFGKGDFELFDIENDPTESQNLVSLYPVKLEEMLVHWKQYNAENGVMLGQR